MQKKPGTSPLCPYFSLLFSALSYSVCYPAVRADTDPRFYAVMITAEVQSSPAQIILHWSEDSNATEYEISRKNDGGWSPVGNVGGADTSWTDHNVSNGGAYEYRVVKRTSVGYRGTGYVYAGINAPLTDNRGKVIFLVDNAFSDPLATELKRMEWDLAGDGWTVLRHDLSRNDTPPNIKRIIKNDYYSEPSNVKAVFIFGHIPVPYSGDFHPDSHDDHIGAWVADTYYGDLDGNWTDSTVSDTSANRPYNHNVPGDGKFDQSDLPSDIEIAVGRVDLSNLTCYANKTPARSELDLLRAYLDKDHNFRHRVFTVARRGLVCDNWGEKNGEAFASSGWRNLGTFFGAQNVTAVGGWQYFPTLKSQDFLWSWAGGGGGWYTCDGVGTSDDFATTPIKSVFTMFFGSYFGDWDNESAFLRAALGSGYCLTTSWAGRPHWFYHHMGLGEPIGQSALLSQNNRGFYENQINSSAHQVHVTLLGDPTLRMHPVIPPANLRGNPNGASINLTWNASGDSGLLGYHVYRGSGPNSSFTRLTASPINSTSFIDTGYSGNGTYMVRAVKLELSGSGTYFNASQGIFYPESGSPDPLPTSPAAPGALTATAFSASQINLSWQDNANDETAFRIERRIGPTGSWSQIAVVPPNTTNYNNTGLALGLTYFYRLFASNDLGSSSPSNEASATTGQLSNTAPAATFLGSDPNTQGSWKGVFGSDGYNVIANALHYPDYLLLNPSNNGDYQWTDQTTDTRALQKMTDGNRVAACWFSESSFTIDLNFIDGTTHKMSLYFLDWDHSGRNQTVELLDSSRGTVLDSRSVSNFSQGTYLTWNVKGSLRVRITKVAGPNALLMGAFFDPAGARPIDPGATTKIILTGGQMHLLINGQPGQKFDIDASDNLKSWINIATVTLSGTTYDFTDDPISKEKTLRFYRVLIAP